MKEMLPEKVKENIGKKTAWFYQMIVKNNIKNYHIPPS